MRKNLEAMLENDQISEWLALARQHLSQNDFVRARQMVQEVQSIRYDDSDALSLLAEIEVRELECARIREENERLYSSALRAYGNGELSTALSKLEKILEVSGEHIGSAVPDRQAVFLTFYNQVRSEQESLESAYNEAARFLREKNFVQALSVCTEAIALHPRASQLQALKVRIEQARQQDLLEYIATIRQRIDNEPGLEHRLEILQEACALYPDERQFQEWLNLSEKHRDLVHSILTDARRYEKDGQFGLALDHWKRLRIIHPEYPGLELAIAQLEDKRNRQIADEEKVARVNEITRAIRSGAVERALVLAEDALSKFPDNSEVKTLVETTRKKVTETRRADEVLQQASKLRGQGQLEEAIKLLRTACGLDDHNVRLRSMLVNLYLERAHLYVGTDWDTAHRLTVAAAELDPQHPRIPHLLSIIRDQQNKERVGLALSRINDVQHSGDLHGAITLAEAALMEFPGELQLQDIRGQLRDRLSGYAETANHETGQDEPAPATQNESEGSTSVEAIVNEGELSQNVTDSSGVPASRRDILGNLRRSFLPFQGKLKQAATWAGSFPGKARVGFVSGIKSVPTSSRKQISVALLVCAAYLMIAGLFHVWPFRPAKDQLKEGQASGTRNMDNRVNPATYAVNLRIMPSNVPVNVDGVDVRGNRLSLTAGKHSISARMPGYFDLRQTFDVDPRKTNLNFALVPRPTVMKCEGTPAGAVITMNGAQQSDTTEVRPDGRDHTVVISSPSGDIRFTFRPRVAARPELLPLPGSSMKRPVVILSTFQHQTAVYAVPDMQVMVSGKTKGRASSTGLVLNELSATESEMVIGASAGRRQFVIGNADPPLLQVFVGEEPNLGSMLVRVNQDGADLSYDPNRPPRTIQHGFAYLGGLTPRTYKLHVTKNNFCVEPKERTVEVKAAEQIEARFDLQPYPSLHLQGLPPNASVTVDDRTALSDPEHVDNLSPGVRHVIRIKAPGYLDLSKNLELQCGPVRTVPVQMNKIPAVQRARLSIVVTPAIAKVEIFRIDPNNQQVPIANGLQSVIELEEGTYKIHASLDGYAEQDKVIALRAGVPQNVNLSLERVISTNRPTAVVPHISGAVAQANLIRRVDPVYPPAAVSAHIEGEVRFSATITQEGDVTDLKKVSGHPLLTGAAREAVLQWKYKPKLIDGKPVAVNADIVVKFTLPH